MQFIFLTLLAVPFLLLIGGAYILDYPVGLGILYGLNLALIYLVLWKVVNQIIKVHTQKMSISGNNLILSCKQMFTSFPVFRHLDLEVPLYCIRSLRLLSTRIGYLLTVHFEQDGKTKGVDLDINPLRIENRDTLREVLSGSPGVEIDKTTENVLDGYAKNVSSWKGSYIFSLLILVLALIIFLFVSVYLGTRVH